MGPVVVGTLKQLRGGQNPEAQQRIDSVLKQLAKQAESAKPPTGLAPGTPGAAAEHDGPPAAPIPQQAVPQVEVINGPVGR
jgi:hypothetical protein